MGYGGTLTTPASHSPLSKSLQYRAETATSPLHERRRPSDYAALVDPQERPILAVSASVISRIGIGPAIEEHDT
jgi:hypothetical protein